MRVRDLKEAIANLPDDTKVEVGKFMALKPENADEAAEVYSVRLDFPMIGLAHSDDGKEICFVVGPKNKDELVWLLKFGKEIQKLEA